MVWKMGMRFVWLSFKETWLKRQGKFGFHKRLKISTQPRKFLLLQDDPGYVTNSKLAAPQQLETHTNS
jgi:hypothetical protein